MLRAIAEAAESGPSQIIMVLAPGMREFIYAPLKEALGLAFIPSVDLHYAEQPQPAGLGDAIPQTEKLVGKDPFAVLLSGDVVRERIGRTAYPREPLRQMEDAQVAAAASVPKSKLYRYVVAKVGSKENIPNILPITQLIEKTVSSHPIFRSTRTFSIVGRYLFHPDIPPIARAKGEKIAQCSLLLPCCFCAKQGRSFMPAS